MRGDLKDIVTRLIAVLPGRWFGEQAQNLNAILACLATPWAWIYQQIEFVQTQTRLQTATDEWLDLFAFDYFGHRLPRGENESDSRYRARIQAALLRPTATRLAISNGLSAIVGSDPSIFEPARCMDTGAYASADTPSAMGLAYGVAGGWGSLLLPFQFFATVARPVTPGVGTVSGYCIPWGGYGVGQAAYVDLSLLGGYITDTEIQQNLADLLPINTTAWLRII